MSRGKANSEMWNDPVLDVLALGNSFAVRSLVREGEAAERYAHQHSEGQLIYVERGTALLETPDAIVRLAPDRASWIPPDLPHSVFIERSFRYHSLYVSRVLYSLPTLRVITVSPLLRELILESGGWDKRNVSFVQRHRKALVIADELGLASTVPVNICIPKDSRISWICSLLESNPGDSRSLQAWADEAGTSAKTVQRAFTASTGLSFHQWRHQVRMARALELHAQGMRVIDIALAIGYATEGAYALAFKRYYGHSPGKLRAAKGP